MERTYEIRWVFSEPQENILSWFDELDVQFKRNEIRMDYYMDLKKYDISVKERDGNLEIKKRADRPRSVYEIHGMYGYLEEWYKWSYKADSVQHDKTNTTGQSSNWLSVNKTRLLAILTEKDNELKFLPKGEEAKNGCQIEYTKFNIDGGKIYYTFCLEWFGNPNLKLSEDIFENLESKNKFCIKDSEGYASFFKLNTQQYNPSDSSVLSLIS